MVAADALASTLSLSIRNRWPSGETSYDRYGNGAAYFFWMTTTVLPVVNVPPAVCTATDVSAPAVSMKNSSWPLRAHTGWTPPPADTCQRASFTFGYGRT